MDKKQADTLALYFAAKAFETNSKNFEGDRNGSTPQKISQLAKELSLLLQQDFGEIDLTVFQGKG